MSCECSVCGRDTSSKLLPMVLAGMFGIVALASVSIVSAERDLSTKSGESISADFDSKFMRVSVGVGKGEVSKTLIIEDVQGKELAQLLMFRDGAYLFQPKDSASGRHMLFHDRKNQIEMGGTHGNIGLHLQADPSGAADLRITDANSTLLRTVRVGETGRVEIAEPSENAFVHTRLAGPTLGKEGLRDLSDFATASAKR